MTIQVLIVLAHIVGLLWIAYLIKKDWKIESRLKRAIAIILLLGFSIWTACVIERVVKNWKIDALKKRSLDAVVEEAIRNATWNIKDPQKKAELERHTRAKIEEAWEEEIEKH